MVFLGPGGGGWDGNGGNVLAEVGLPVPEYSFRLPEDACAFLLGYAEFAAVKETANDLADLGVHAGLFVEEDGATR
jgi:hypothetical protein